MHHCLKEFMNWRVILSKLHPEHLLDCLVNVMIHLMETWAIVRVTIILSLVLATIIMNAWDVTPSKQDVADKLKEYHENFCTSDWMHDTNLNRR